MNSPCIQGNLGRKSSQWGQEGSSQGKRGREVYAGKRGREVYGDKRGREVYGDKRGREVYGGKRGWETSLGSRKWEKWGKLCNIVLGANKNRAGTRIKGYERWKV